MSGQCPNMSEAVRVRKRTYCGLGHRRTGGKRPEGRAEKEVRGCAVRRENKQDEQPTPGEEREAGKPRRKTHASGRSGMRSEGREEVRVMRQVSRLSCSLFLLH